MAMVDDWTERQEVSSIERDWALEKLRILYEAVRFAEVSGSPAGHRSEATLDGSPLVGPEVASHHESRGVKPSAGEMAKTRESASGTDENPMSVDFDMDKMLAVDLDSEVTSSENEDAVFEVVSDVPVAPAREERTDAPAGNPAPQTAGPLAEGAAMSPDAVHNQTDITTAQNPGTGNETSMREHSTLPGGAVAEGAVSSQKAGASEGAGSAPTRDTAGNAVSAESMDRKADRPVSNGVTEGETPAEEVFEVVTDVAVSKSPVSFHAAKAASSRRLEATLFGMEDESMRHRHKQRVIMSLYGSDEEIPALEPKATTSDHRHLHHTAEEENAEVNFTLETVRTAPVADIWSEPVAPEALREKPQAEEVAPRNESAAGIAAETAAETLSADRLAPEEREVEMTVVELEPDPETDLESDEFLSADGEGAVADIPAEVFAGDTTPAEAVTEEVPASVAAEETATVAAGTEVETPASVERQKVACDETGTSADTLAEVAVTAEPETQAEPEIETETPTDILTADSSTEPAVGQMGETPADVLVDTPAADSEEDLEALYKEICEEASREDDPANETLTSDEVGSLAHEINSVERDTLHRPVKILEWNLEEEGFEEEPESPVAWKTSPEVSSSEELQAEAHALMSDVTPETVSDTASGITSDAAHETASDTAFGIISDTAPAPAATPASESGESPMVQSLPTDGRFGENPVGESSEESFGRETDHPMGEETSATAVEDSTEESVGEDEPLFEEFEVETVATAPAETESVPNAENASDVAPDTATDEDDEVSFDEITLEKVTVASAPVAESAEEPATETESATFPTVAPVATPAETPATPATPATAPVAEPTASVAAPDVNPAEDPALSPAAASFAAPANSVPASAATPAADPAILAAAPVADPATSVAVPAAEPAPVDHAADGPEESAGARYRSAVERFYNEDYAAEGFNTEGRTAENVEDRPAENFRHEAESVTDVSDGRFNDEEGFEEEEIDPNRAFTEIYTTPSSLPHHNDAVLGEVINPHVQTLGDVIEPRRDMATRISHLTPVTDLEQAIGINDKFLLIRDLFDGDADAYREAIRSLNSFDDLDDCLIHIAENYSWNPNSDGAKLLMDLLERKFV